LDFERPVSLSDSRNSLWMCGSANSQSGQLAEHLSLGVLRVDRQRADVVVVRRQVGGDRVRREVRHRVAAHPVLQELGERRLLGLVVRLGVARAPREHERAHAGPAADLPGLVEIAEPAPRSVDALERRPAGTQLAVELGLPAKRTTCGGPGSPASVRVEWIEATSLAPYPRTGSRPTPAPGMGDGSRRPQFGQRQARRRAVALAARRRGRGPLGLRRGGLPAGALARRRGAGLRCPGFGGGDSATRGALAQRMSSDFQTMTRPPATGWTTASWPAVYARRSVLIDGQAFERSAAASPMSAARAWSSVSRVSVTGGLRR